MSSILHQSLKRILELRETLPRDYARQLLDAILANQTQDPSDEIRIAALLGALAARGETTEELAGFVDALRARLIPVPLTDSERNSLVDTCGTGGDLSGTFNISTASALVAAAAGATVAKHGNRAVTSRSGSADVLEALGIPVNLSPEAAAQALRTHRFAFLAAPNYQPAMRALLPARKAIGIRTAFNILGPITNPAAAPAQIMGVYSPHLVPIVAQVFAALNTRHAFVVHGAGGSAGGPGMDEISISGPTDVAEVRGQSITYRTLTPADFGLDTASIQSLAGGDCQHNAAILRAIFAAERSPRRDVVVLNAAAVLVLAGLAPDFSSAARLAESTIDSNKVSALVSNLAT